MTSVRLAAYFENFLTMWRAGKASDGDYDTLCKWQLAVKVTRHLLSSPPPCPSSLISVDIYRLSASYVLNLCVKGCEGDQMV